MQNKLRFNPNCKITSRIDLVIVVVTFRNVIDLRSIFKTIYNKNKWVFIEVSILTWKIAFDKEQRKKKHNNINVI